MAYKVLGQAVASAATADVTVNLVKEPLGPQTNYNTTGTTNSMQVTGTSPYWRYQTPSTTNQSANATATLDVGSTYAWNFFAAGGNTSGTVRFGYATGSTSGGTGIDTANALVVTAGTTYYFGAYIRRNGTAVTSPNMSIRWFNSSGTFLSATDLSLTIATDTWTRTKSSVAAPTNAAYATILFTFSVSTNTSWECTITGVHFSDSSLSDTTFPFPSVVGSNGALISPYIYRTSNKWSGTANNSTTITTYAGAYSDLYTVPANSSTVISTIAITNTGTTGTTYRLVALPTGDTRDLKHHFIFDATLGAKESQYITNGLTLPASSKIQVSADNTAVVFNAFGSEN